MFIKVRLLNGFTKELTYKVPVDWRLENLIGSIVHVPIKNRIETAIIKEAFEKPQQNQLFKIREAKSIEPFPNDKFYPEFIKQLSKYFSIENLYFYKKIRQFLKEKKSTNSTILPKNQIVAVDRKQAQLTEEQEKIVLEIEKKFNQKEYYPSLIHGVTGSGKTEIYKKLIIKTIKLGKSCLFLFPEVSLSIQFQNLLKNSIPENIQIFGFHSSTSVKEKKALWKNIVDSKPSVILGVHLPVFLPISNLGLIILDEEHDSGYQEKKHPKINTKEAALIRAKISNIPIILGSATPSISSIFNIKHKNWNLFQLKKRYSGNFPKIKIVKLNENKNRKSFWITKELEKSILNRLENKEQTIIFLNRRGYSFFIQCKECGYKPTCKNCTVTLTLHNNKTLICHYCNYNKLEPENCTECKNSKDFIKTGIGTQQIVNLLEKKFPNAKIARADLDSTINKKKWQQIIQDFEDQKIDILVGTQTITKGYHFPNVTLIGILWADINLSIPIYNSSETTLQQLIQVAGRAGRQSQKSEVIIQTLIDHKIYDFINEIDYLKFYDYEINNRKLVQYPPFIRFAEIELKNQDSEIIEKESKNLANQLTKLVINNNLEMKILGPVPPTVVMIKKIISRKIYIKAKNIDNILNLYSSIDKKSFSSNIFITLNPLT